MRRPSLNSLLRPTLVLLVAFGLRAHRLALDSVWWDEGFSVYMARMPLHFMAAATARDAHPPVYYAMLHIWRGLAGEEEFALRLPSVFCGLLVVALTYRLGREVGGRRVGLLGAILTACARLPVWWSQEIRMYTLAALWAALSLWAAVRLFDERRRAWLWALLFGLASAAGLLTLYLYAGVLLAESLAFVYVFAVSRRRVRLLGWWAAANLLALALVAPWVWFALPRLPSWTTPQAPVDLWYVAKLYASTLFLGIATSIESYAPLLIASAVGLIGLGWLAWRDAPRHERRAWMLLAACVVTPLVVVYLLSLPRGRFNYPTPSPRYFVLLAAPVYALIGWGLAVLERRRRAAGVVGLVAWLALFGWSLRDYYAGLRLTDDYQSMGFVLRLMRRDDQDAVLLNNDQEWPIFAYHYPGEWVAVPYAEQIHDEKYAAALLEPLYFTHSGLWVVQTRNAAQSDPHNQLLRWLDKEARASRHYTFSEGELWFYALGERRLETIDQARRMPPAPHPLDLSIAPGLRLTGFSQPVPVLDAGGRLTVGLVWESQGPGEWPIAVVAVGPGGEAARGAATITAGEEPMRGITLVALSFPVDAPGGRYRLLIEANGTSWPFDHLRVVPRPPLTSAERNLPRQARRLDVRFGESIELAGVELPEMSFAPGDGIPLTLYWRASAAVGERYKVFVHLVGAEPNPDVEGGLWGQQDQEPQGGAAVTSTWRPGQVIADGYLVPIDPSAPPGEYQLEVGLYHPQRGERLPAFDPDGTPLGDHVVVGQVAVGGE
jgi:hypothetical protein